MERLIAIIRGLFTDLDNIQKLLAPLAEKLLRDIPNVNGCKQALLDMIRDGSLDDDFKADPFKVLLCIGYVILDIASFYEGHDHSDDLIADAPVFAKTPEDDDYYVNLGVLLGVNPLSTGPFTNLLYSALLDRLVEELKRFVAQLDKEQIMALLQRFVEAITD